MQLAEFGTGAARERALLQAGLLQQGFGQAQAARQQDIANQIWFRTSTTRVRCFPSRTRCTTTSFTRNRYFNFRKIGRFKPSASTSST